MHRSVGYYSEATADVMYRSQQEILVENYIKMTAKGKEPGPEEKLAWKAFLAERLQARSHQPNCYCNVCRG